MTFFFAIKGRKNDGNKFVGEAFKKKASIAIVNRIQNNYNYRKQIKVQKLIKIFNRCIQKFLGKILIQNYCYYRQLWKNNSKRIIRKFIKKNF